MGEILGLRFMLSLPFLLLKTECWERCPLGLYQQAISYYWTFNFDKVCFFSKCDAYQLYLSLVLMDKLIVHDNLTTIIRPSDQIVTSNPHSCNLEILPSSYFNCTTGVHLIQGGGVLLMLDPYII